MVVKTMDFLLLFFFSSLVPLFFLIGSGPNCAHICVWRSMHSSKLELQNEAEFMYLDSKAVQKFGTLYIVLPQPCLASSPRKATVTLSKVILLLKAKQGL